ncbi:methyltransferase domain-containing protein [Spirosoma sp. BT702]|uniref:Methyltransferase domain-containing protein n=1 Tax=Spirosoma profusum TaxID=2771354 RepID=A0A927AVT0_9BACT|nr:methyltransferase domain-containing protein [Spirosoma profusum]MBD2705327.1 methyltransferase domain-containing protein [Spirosoma profusum]
MNPSNRSWNADLYQQKHAFVFHFGVDVLKLLDPQPGERILDLGCGTGELTARIAERGAEVIGLDASLSMIAKARESFPHLSFQQGDARDFGTDQPFDALFSNATLHWINETEQPSVLAAVFNALKPGGRFVAELGGRGNVARILNALANALTELGKKQPVNLNFFPSVGEYTTTLETAGFSITLAQFFDRDTPLTDPETGLSDWITMFRGDLLTALSDQDRQTVLATVNNQLRPTNFRDGHWFADYKRLRFVAVKPLES